MEQQHPELPTYGSPAPDARSVLVYGNCQAPYLARALGSLQDLNEDYRFAVANSYVFPGEPASRPVPEAILRSARLLLVQHEDREDNPALLALRERLPADCAEIRFPSFLMTCLWPFECAEPRGAREPGYFWKRYPFGDLVGLEVAAMGLQGAAGVAAYLDLSAQRMPDLRARLERDLERMRRHDARCDVKLGDYVGSAFRREHLFWVNGHVSGAGIAELAARVLEAARPVLGGRSRPGAGRADDAPPDGMGALQVPIHPMVAEALGLAFWSPDLRYLWYGQRWTFYDYVERYIAYDVSW